jgi:hypothetical protein
VRITSLEIENFRCFGTRTRVDFAPITLLFGANSVGKSSILGALDLMRVLLTEVDLSITEDYCRGTAADLGGYPSMVHQHNQDRSIVLALTIDLGDVTAEPGLSDANHLSDTPDGYDMLGVVDERLGEVWVRCVLSWSRARKRAWVSSFSLGTAGEPESLIEIQSPGDRRQASQLSFWLRHPLIVPGDSARDEEEFGEFEFSLMEETEAGLGQCLEIGEPPINRFVIPVYGVDGAVPHASRQPRLLARDSFERRSAMNGFVRQLLGRTVLGITDRIRECVAGIVRIGPLRTVPPRNHQARRHTVAADWFDGLAAWDLLHTGSEGLVSGVSRWMESIGSGYQIRKRSQYYYSSMLPSAIALAETVADTVARAVDFDGADEGLDGDVEVSVSVDIRTAKFAQHEVREAGSHTEKTQVTFQPVGASISLHPADVGVGISQVMPIITGAVHFSAARSAFVAIEQPELHIHPRLQLGIGDLLIDAVKRTGGANCTFLIETHSEHLMLRMLRRIREASEAEDDRLQPSMIAVWNVRRAEDANIVEAKRMWIEPDGEFSERWDGGFFHERGEELF